MILRLPRHTFTFPRPAMVMGIVNVTPDSFSDGGRFVDAKKAIEHALEQVEQGADIIDIGGESTRPNAEPVPEEEELRRVLPVVRELARESNVPVPLSIDTMKIAVARAALEEGASMVNDIAGHRTDDEMWKLVRDTGAAYVMMHMRGTPQSMQGLATYADVADEVSRFFALRLEQLCQFGVELERVTLDPGIGFAKKVDHNLQLLAGLSQFTKYQRPLLVGASRKGFIGQVTGAAEVGDRLAGSLACACAAVQAGASIIRAHDVAATRQALRMVEAIAAGRLVG